MIDYTAQLRHYSEEVTKLVASDTTNEQTYYPAVRTLLADILRSLKLPSDVRLNTSERRSTGGIDVPDLAIYDGAGDFVLVCGEVKLPGAEMAAMATSTDRNDQIGRYLARTRAVILCNVRAFGLLTVDPDYSAPGPVPPASRKLELSVDLWPSVNALKRGAPIDPDTRQQLIELVETSVTRFAPIAEPETLARILARQARRAKQNLPERFSQAVQGLSEDFGKALGITFEGEEGIEFFRSSLVQTVFYGLFAGWMLHQQNKEPEPFRWQELPQKLKIPFLGDLLYDIQHPTRMAELHLTASLDQAAETFQRVHIETFMQRLKLPSFKTSDDAAQAAATAILYFYEPFLETFDPVLRQRLGVWYTPPEIVRYQVRKVDQLLRDEQGLNCPLGFADESVVVLDPCCGTGAYLIEVLHCIAETLRGEGIEDDLADRLLHALCRRIIGFEILTAPFVIAHLQLFLMLTDLGVSPRPGERPAVFLTNALTGWEGPDQAKLNFPELQQEHDAARAVKTDARIIVVLGNPPYNRFVGLPIAEESDLTDPYKGITRDARGRQVGQSTLYTHWGIRKHLLNDLYIRFFRLAEKRIAIKSEYGIVSFISNSSFYIGRSHPIMRESLISNFDEIWVDNLNGDKYRTGKIIPDGLPGAGTADQSVFSSDYDPRGIQVGTGITTCIRRLAGTTASSVATIHYRDFWGRSAAKRAALLDSLQMSLWNEDRKREAAARPEGPRLYESYVPTQTNRWKLLPRADAVGYEDWPALDELFPAAFQGVNPNRGLEGSVVSIDRGTLEARMQEYFSAMPYEEFSIRHPELCTPRALYEPETVRDRLKQGSRYQPDRIMPYEIFPLDMRWIYYETDAHLLNRHRPELRDNLANNEFLISVPQPRRISESLPLLATCLFDLHLHDRGSVGFPAHVRSQPQAANLFDAPTPVLPKANLDPAIWERLKQSRSLHGDLDGADARDLVRRLFRVCLAICHAPQYQQDHADSLSQDWAHVPIPVDTGLFDRLAAAGNRIATLLDPMKNARSVIQTVLGENAAQLAVLKRVGGGALRGTDFVITISHYGAAKGGWRQTEDATGDLYINPDVYFQNVPESVWRYELGGYPVIKKWLGYRDAQRRNNTPLSPEERDQLRDIVRRLSAMLALQAELDRLYTEATATVIALEPPGPVASS